MASVCPGEELRITGDWAYDKCYGKEFRVRDFESIKPTTIQGIQKYLGSGLIKGIGPVLASRLVARFGLQTLTVIENEPHKLKQVEGIGHQRVQIVVRAWQEHKEMRGLLVFLSAFGVSNSIVLKIFDYFGKCALDIITQNPYRLLEVRGIGFRTADRIALKVGIPEDSPERCQAAIIYVLQRMAEDGHTYCPYRTLLDRSSKLLNVQLGIISDALARLLANNKIVIAETERSGQW